MQIETSETAAAPDFFSGWISRMAQGLPLPPDTTPQERRTYHFASFTFPQALIVHFLLIFLFAYWGILPLALFNIFSVLLYASTIILTRRGRIHLSYALFIGEFVIHTALVVYFVGWGMGMQYFLINLVIGAMLLAWPLWLRLAGAMAITAIFMYLYYYALGGTPQVPVDPTQLNIVNAIITPFAFMSMAFTMLFAISIADQLEVQLEIEHYKSEALLNNILPRAISVRLKSSKATIADYLDGVTVLFADVVNFTPLSARMAPADLVDLLNTVFSDFDDLTEKYGLEKIKTIGDCYMVAAGVPLPREDHAQIITQMALEMQELVAANAYSGHQLAFRIGIDSGPVVAGVIGRKKFIYDLWGDTVNTASRMESHGSSGNIQISRATYELIKDEFNCEPQGSVNVKGKGEMDVWYVTGHKNNSSPQTV